MKHNKTRQKHMQLNETYNQIQRKAETYETHNKNNMHHAQPMSCNNHDFRSFGGQVALRISYPTFVKLTLLMLQVRTSLNLCEVVKHRISQQRARVFQWFS
jgi:hypothetical protein